MGTSERGEHNTYQTIRSNAEATAKDYPLKDGYFGVKGKSSDVHKRHIYSNDPIGTAQDFFEKMSTGAHIRRSMTNYGEEIIIATLPDHGIITFRRISKSDGTPAVEINIRNSTDHGSVKQQKIHFEEGEHR